MKVYIDLCRIFALRKKIAHFQRRLFGNNMLVMRLCGHLNVFRGLSQELKMSMHWNLLTNKIFPLLKLSFVHRFSYENMPATVGNKDAFFPLSLFLACLLCKCTESKTNLYTNILNKLNVLRWYFMIAWHAQLNV